MATAFSVDDLSQYYGHDTFLDAVDAMVKDMEQPLPWNDW